MSRKTLLIILTTFIMAMTLITGVVYAQISSTPGSTKTYTGFLVDPSGLPVADGEYDFIFTLYPSEKADGALWVEMQSGVSVKSGNLNVILGQFTPISKDLAESRIYGYRLACEDQRMLTSRC